MKRILAIILALPALFADLPADSWPGPQVANVFSEDGKRFVRIEPGGNVAGTFGFAGARQGANATALFYQLGNDRSYQLIAEVSLANPVAPIDLLLSNSGYLLTLDNWHNMGYGKVVAVYNPQGKMVASYELEQLYSPEQLRSIPKSVSSRWWRCKPFHFVDPETQTRVYLREALGGYFVFKLGDGSFDYTQGNSACD